MSYLRRIIPSSVRPYASGLLWRSRQVTWRSRVLPDLVIIGAQKAGTSSMYSYLSQHPQLLPPFRKEVHYFDGGLDPSVDDFEKGEQWYRAHFPLRKKIGVDQKTFEASPLYIFNPLVPRRIFDLIPKVKIIALLRNPTDRAISQYFHEKRIGREPLSIYEALQREDALLESVLNEKDYKNDIFIHHSYKNRGLYKKQLEKYLRYFPRNKILVINSESFFSEPSITLERVFEFVGVDTGYRVKDLAPRKGYKIKDLTSRNEVNSRSDVAPDVYEYLNEFFLPHNQALYELVGEDYGW